MLTPVIFVSHGSPFMSFKDSDSGRYWKEFGKGALENGIKGVVFVGAHWEEINDRIRVATKQAPRKLHMDICPEETWKPYKINVDRELAHKVIALLSQKGFHDVAEDPETDWQDDTLIPSPWMFPGGTPPATIVSMNARYSAAFHVEIGRALASLREEGILIVCTGGAVHNLYRNNWLPLVLSRDNFQPGTKPALWATKFAQAVNDVVTQNSKEHLIGALTRLTRSPLYREAHPTDDHFFPLLVAAGFVEESGEQGEWKARTWELTNMCNDQFVWGSWPSATSSCIADS